MEQTLMLEIHPADLARIRAAQLRIIVARSAPAAQPNVVWESLEPFPLRTLTWRKAVHGLYAATADVIPGARVIPVALQSEAQAGYYYSFTSSAVFQGPYWDSQVAPDAYGVTNAMPYSSYPQLTFGLSQVATINGTPASEKPVTASPVLSGYLAVFPPVPMVYVWLESGVVSSTVIARVGPGAVALDYSEGDTKQLIYDPDLGRFVVKPGPAGLDPEEL
jgi:hypothetical protein